MKTYFTSESVTAGHPDKLCDRVADSILDELLKQDEMSRVACEVCATTNKLHIMGEITTKAKIDYEAVARKCIREIGYTELGHGFDCDTCDIEVDIHEQSHDIAVGIDRKDILDSGAGDQGIIFGFACNETANLMPMPIELAHTLAGRLEYVRKSKILPYLLPDGKVQVTVEYENNKSNRISAVIVSAHHNDTVSTDILRDDIIENVIRPALPAHMLDDDTVIYINPTGLFINGGPAADSGLTGKKIIVDTYGGYARHGGGSFSGKDATKVDRSGAYMARYLAKNIVASDMADKCEIQISYSIGLADPISVMIETFGTQKCAIEEIYDFIKAVDLRPFAIINRFHLRKPIYSNLSSYGHFGQNARNMPWEQTDLKETL